ncbi:MAG: hypothetical protein K0M50_16840 [Prolixibacteraceae bacterium]|nr:hypothetical protein [Prolixibacteraceae bacterium]
MERLIKISEEQVITVKVVKRVFEVSLTNGEITTKLDITGVSVLPQFLIVKPNDIRDSIINKDQAVGGVAEIEKSTKRGIYFVNIRDYTSDEIQYFSQYLSEKLFSEIWTTLTSIETKPFSISLKDEKVKEIILKENSEIFKNENEFEFFCEKYGLTINTFISPANFSELEIKLKEIDARFELEQFFGRRYLFCSTLIGKLNSRIAEYTSNGNRISTDRLTLINFWIEEMNLKLEVLSRFKDYYKLYDMPKSYTRVEIKNSKNINIVGGNISDSKITQEVGTKSDSKTSKVIGIWTIVFMALGLIVTIIIYRDKIF